MTTISFTNVAFEAMIIAVASFEYQIWGVGREVQKQMDTLRVDHAKFRCRVGRNATAIAAVYIAAVPDVWVRAFIKRAKWLFSVLHFPKNVMLWGALHFQFRNRVQWVCRVEAGHRKYGWIKDNNERATTKTISGVREDLDPRRGVFFPGLSLSDDCIRESYNVENPYASRFDKLITEKKRSNFMRHNLKHNQHYEFQKILSGLHSGLFECDEDNFVLLPAGCIDLVLTPNRSDFVSMGALRFLETEDSVISVGLEGPHKRCWFTAWWAIGSRTRGLARPTDIVLKMGHRGVAKNVSKFMLGELYCQRSSAGFGTFSRSAWKRALPIFRHMTENRRPRISNP